jgi:hypothetical protein
MRKTAQSMELNAEEKAAPMQADGVFRYLLTKNEVLSAYNEARRLFAGYHDETAKTLLNQILESNASEAIKNKARILISYMDPPDWTSLKDRIAFSKVKEDPILYRGCYVIWRGRAGNVLTGDTSTSFDLLVGYDNENRLEGVVRVVFPFAAPVNNALPVEVLGKVVPDNSEKDGLRLEGAALNQAAGK